MAHAERAPFHSQEPRGFDVEEDQAVPGHDGAPVASAARGGARGWVQRSKVSMMRMRPPQQGQGGSWAGGSSISTGSGVGGDTASHSRTRAMLALRVALANNP